MAATPLREHLHTAIEDVLRRHFTERSAAAESYGEEFTALWRTAAGQALGGKLIRPSLLVDTFHSLSQESIESVPDAPTVLEIAASVELLHYSFLLHDDVIDGDLVRRGRPNLIGALGGARTDDLRGEGSGTHWARTGAILMGDLLLSSAILGFARAALPEQTRLRLLDLLEHTVLETVAGEHTDVGFSDGIITPDLTTILSMTTHKTATYSFELPLRAAAILAGTASTVEAALTAVGRHLGLAYQLQDDLLSVFGDPSSHGKDPFSDIREGKETAIIAYARMTSAWPSIEPGFGTAELSERDGAEIRDRLRECGAERFAANLVDEQLAVTYTVLAEAEESSTIPRETQKTILSIAASIEGRRR